ncbi:MAG: ribonuclease P protein component [Defluviitaleaceae bacterium]|nr:ribonuclease P protein component [Defluviitaleaceae bacterium]
MKILKKKAIGTLKREEFSRVYNKGLFFANKHLVIYILKQANFRGGCSKADSLNSGHSENPTIYGISVSKKVGKAVIRNRMRRLIKESLRLLQYDIKKGYSIIVVARNSENRDFKTIDISLKKLLKKANMLS